MVSFLLYVSPFGAGMPNPGERLGFNLVCKKCSPQNYKGGGGLGGSKVGWVGPKLGGWVLSKIPPPPLINEAWQGDLFVYTTYARL